MTRIWDWIVASVMIVIGLVAQAILSGLIAVPVIVGLNSLGLKNAWVTWVAFGLVLVVVNAAGLVDYYWLRRVNKANVFHFIPRAIERIRTGYELPNAVSAETGMPIDLQEPIRAGTRLIAGLLTMGLAVTAFLIGVSSRHDLAMILAACGLIAFVVGVIVVLQAALAYAGFIRRTH